jgi:uncharacterized damage-inducible protein DinB
VIPDSLAGLKATRAQTLAALAPLSQAQLDFSPGPGRWSIGEVADHLLLAEGLYRDEIARLVALARAGQRPYLKRSFDDINVAPLHLPTPILSLLQVPFSIMSRMLPDQVRSIVTEFPVLPTRNPDAATPRRGRPGAELRAALARSLAQTSALVEANGDLDFTGMISEHPLTGASDVPQILRFLSLHERRHQGQMERVRSISRFPRQ